MTPPHIKAKRTIFINGLDKHVGQRTSDEIASEITKNHDFIRNITVHKIKTYTHIIKLICEDTTQADRIIQNGLTAFHTRISPHQCSLERHTELLICFNCYKYESHTKHQCPSKQIVCSECAETGHTHRQCTSTEKRCLNCPKDNNFHRTLDNKCPVKKQATINKENKLKAETEKHNNKTYSDIVKNTIKQTAPPPKPTIQLTNKVHLKLIALVIEAHVASIGDSRPYNEILSESLRLNYGLDIKLPDRDSQKILDIYLNPENQSDDMDIPHTDEYADDDEPSFNAAPPPCSTPIKFSLPTEPMPPLETLSPRGARPKRRMSPEEAGQNKQSKQDNKPRYKVRILRSEDDPEPIPKEISAEWVNHQLNNRHKLGIKIHLTGDLEQFNKDVKTGIFHPHIDQIRMIDDATYQQFHRVCRYDDRP